MGALHSGVVAVLLGTAALTFSVVAAAGDETTTNITWKGAPVFSTPDGSFKFKVRGRLHTDYVAADQDEEITGAPDINAAEIRRARLGVEGVLFSDIAYVFEVDFATGEPEIFDAFFTYTGLPVGVTLGQFRTYNSLEELTSANYITFMERAAITDAFDLERQIGVGLDLKREQYTLAAGVFGANAADSAPDEGTTFSARATAAPILDEEKVLHLGAHYRHRERGDLPDYSYGQRAADLHLTDRFVDTGGIGDSDSLWGLELAGVWGSWSFQSEYMELTSDAPTLGLDPTYDGWYADLSWFVTGESRPYKEGVFGRVKVINPVGQGGFGAWQIAARYDFIDLSEGGCLECGEQATWLLGVNWHLNDYTRLMLNLAQSEIDGGINDGADIKALGLRAQIDW